MHNCMVDLAPKCMPFKITLCTGMQGEWHSVKHPIWMPISVEITNRNAMLCVMTQNLIFFPEDGSEDG